MSVSIYFFTFIVPPSPLHCEEGKELPSLKPSCLFVLFVDQIPNPCRLSLIAATNLLAAAFGSGSTMKWPPSKSLAVCVNTCTTNGLPVTGGTRRPHAWAGPLPRPTRRRDVSARGAEWTLLDSLHEWRGTSEIDAHGVAQANRITGKLFCGSSLGRYLRPRAGCPRTGE